MKYTQKKHIMQAILVNLLKYLEFVNFYPTPSPTPSPTQAHPQFFLNFKF